MLELLKRLEIEVIAIKAFYKLMFQTACNCLSC